MIIIKSKDSNEYIIEYVSSVDISKAQQSAKYEEFVELMNTIDDYKNKFMSIDV
jgi:hypothetical protein